MKSDQSPDPNDSLTEKLKRIVLDNLQNEQFGVSELASMSGMSRSHLHRKLSLLKNQSISQFIREIRLREAFKLLKSGTYNASEVAYKVGFNNPSYFNKCFNEYYGFPPGKAKSRIVSSSFNGIKSNRNSVREDNVLSIAFKAKPKKAFVQRRILWILTSVIIVAAFIIASKIWWVHGHFEQEPVESVLILPFDNYTGDSRLDYFVSGMHSSLITEIGILSGLRVISETTSKAFQNAGISLKEIAEELSVDAIVETAVTCLGDSI